MTLEHQPPAITENLADNVGLTPMVRILPNKSNNSKSEMPIHFDQALAHLNLLSTPESLNAFTYSTTACKT